jgi:hypothetical protein
MYYQLKIYLTLLIFINVYSLYRGIYCDNSGQPYIVHWLDHPHHSPTPSLPHLKQLQEVSSFYFIYVYETHHNLSFKNCACVKICVWGGGGRMKGTNGLDA